MSISKEEVLDGLSQNTLALEFQLYFNFQNLGLTLIDKFYYRKLPKNPTINEILVAYYRYNYSKWAWKISQMHSNYLFSLATRQGDFEIVKLLDASGEVYNVYVDDITSACFMGHIQIVKYLCEESNRSKFELLNSHPGSENRFLRNASVEGHLEVVKYLIAKYRGVITNIISCFYESCQHGHLDVAKYLYEIIDPKNKIGIAGTALMLHSVCEHPKVVEFLRLHL